jgi:hypothetical protein
MKELDVFTAKFNVQDIYNKEKYRELEEHFQYFIYFLVKYYRVFSLDKSTKRSELTNIGLNGEIINMIESIHFKEMGWLDLIENLWLQSIGLFLWMFMSFFFHLRYVKKNLSKDTSRIGTVESLQKIITHLLSNSIAEKNADIIEDEYRFNDCEILDLYSIFLEKLNLYSEEDVGSSDVSLDTLPLVSQNDDSQNSFYSKTAFVKKNEKEPFDPKMPRYSDIHGSMEFFINYLSINKLTFYYLNTGIQDKRSFKTIEQVRNFIKKPTADWSKLNSPLWKDFKNGENAKEMILSWLIANEIKLSDVEQNDLERSMIAVSVFPGVPFCQVLHALYYDESKQKEMKLKAMCFLPRLQKITLLNYQPKLSKHFDFFNPNTQSYNYFANPKDTKETYFTGDIFALFILGKIISNEMLYTCFVYVFVILHRSFQKYSHQITEYSHKSPLFIHAYKNKFYLLYKGEFYYSNIYALIEIWIRLNKAEGIPPAINYIECPWLRDWLDELPKSFEEFEVFHKIAITKNYIEEDKIYEPDEEVVKQMEEVVMKPPKQVKRKLEDFDELFK